MIRDEVLEGKRIQGVEVTRPHPTKCTPEFRSLTLLIRGKQVLPGFRIRGRSMRDILSEGDG